MDIRISSLCFAFFSIIVNLSEQCRQINSCACLYDDGSLVDLAPLSITYGAPYFHDATTKGNFYWNPCNPFSLSPTDSACQDVAMCMTRLDQFYDLGRQDSASFKTDDSGIMSIEYTFTGDIKRASKVELKCIDMSQPDKFTLENVIQNDNYTLYVMSLESKHACRYMPVKPTPSKQRTTIEPEPRGQCRKRNSCSCQYANGPIVDLSALSRADGKANFNNVSNSAGNEYYSWNPCVPFTYGNNTACKNVAVCMLRQGIPSMLSYNLGEQDSADFMVDKNGSLTLTYTASQGYFLRKTEITLQCLSTSKFDFFVAEGEQAEVNDTVLFKLLLASKYACAYAPVVETTTISVPNHTSEPVLSTKTSQQTPNPTSNSPGHSEMSTFSSTKPQDNNGTTGTHVTTTSNSPSLGASTWIIMYPVLFVFFNIIGGGMF